jgi:outer membrane protein OmpA-like peptidoglycan-associated protein
MKNSWMRLIGCVALTALLMAITACSDRNIPAYVQNPTLKNLSTQQRTLLRDISQSHIQVIKRGMLFTFVIPTDYFFESASRALKPAREKALDRLAQFIHDYTLYFAHPQVSVSGYTDKTWLSPARDLLSLHYADAIAEFLREDGIDSGMIKMRGEGAKNPIASNRDASGTTLNRRVVVEVS